MTKILFADNDYPDIELERALFAHRRRRDVVTAQCKTEDDVIAHGKGCRAILLQYAPITERVLEALPELGIVSRIGAGYDTVDTDACEKRGVWVANSPDYGVGEVATHALALALASIRNIVALPPRHRRGHAGTSCRPARLRRPARADARHRRPRPHRQADGAHLAQRVQARRRVRPLSDRRRFPGLRRARALAGASWRAGPTSSRCTRRSTRRRAA